MAEFDSRGLRISTESPQAAAYYRDGVDLLLSTWPGADDALRLAIDHDHEFALAHAALARLHAMTETHRFIWIQGNHDPAPPNGVGGEWVETFATTTLTFRHQAITRAEAEISGHHHPKAAIPARGTSVSRPCFVTDSHRIVMPAFGAYTGGMDVREPAIARLFPRGGRVFLLGKERLYSFTLGTLRA